MAYTAKTITGAQARVRQLEKLLAEHDRLLTTFDEDRKRMAKLAADGPAFYNPLEIYHAKERRNLILKDCGLKPDGSPL